jgi:glutathionyl-hydroquinone reductase
MTAAQPSSGTFEREPVALDERITSDGSTRWPVEPGRYRLVVARPARGPTGR